jgi:hypothetical protein
MPSELSGSDWPFLTQPDPDFAAILDLAVSIAIAINSSYNSRQKILQIAIVWAIPVLGSTLLGLFMLTQREEETPPSRYPSESGEEVNKIWSALHPPNEKQ